MIIKAGITHIEVMTDLATVLWNEKYDILRSEIEDKIKKSGTAYFIKIINDDPVGFAQCQLRNDYVEGTNSSPVGYLEGIFVKEEYRHQNIGTELIKECELWTKDKGCTECVSQQEST